MTTRTRAVWLGESREHPRPWLMKWNRAPLTPSVTLPTLVKTGNNQCERNGYVYGIRSD